MEGDGNNFNDRLNQVFGGLDSLEQKHSETVATFEHDDDDRDKDKDNDKEDEDMCRSPGERSSDGGGHRNTTPGNNNKKKNLAKCDLRKKLNNKKRQHDVPDHVANPEKWKKYSLKDDGSVPISKGRSADQVNTAVAMQFLQQLKQQKDTGSDDTINNEHNKSSSSSSCDGSKDDNVTCDDAHIFQVPSLPLRKVQTEAEQQVATSTGGIASCHSSKARCMETYEFGGGRETHKKLTIAANKNNDDNTNDTNEIDNEVTGAGAILEYCNDDDREEVEDLGAKEKSNEVDLSKDTTLEHKEEDTSVKFKSRSKKKNRVIRKQVVADDCEE